jgi:MYND finger
MVHQDEEDYYTEEMLNRIWMAEWYEQVLQPNSPWFRGELPKEQTIAPQFQLYNPYVCHGCKRGPALMRNNTTDDLKKLFVCSGCRVIQYCCREHQKADWAKHKVWCKAFTEFRTEVDMTHYTSRQEWSQAVPLLLGELTDRYVTRLHSTESQIIALQPRCRKCYKAGMDPSVKLVPCPGCAGVALCSDCVEETSSDFHWDSSYRDPRRACAGYLLALCCTGMVVEKGHPLGSPSDTDETTLWHPKDWLEYFARKRGDFGYPERLLNLAPVACFLTDHLSTALTLHHVLALPEVDLSNLTKLIIHVCGAAAGEVLNFEAFIELSRLHPKLRQLTVRLIGPRCFGTTQHLQTTINSHRIRETCQITMSAHRTLYHDAELSSEIPTVALLPQSGIGDACYTDDWRPTLKRLGSLDNVPIIFTGFNRSEVIDDWDKITEWGLRTIVPPRNNPFRGLRPFLDPMRDPHDFIYSNSTFAVARGMVT